LFFKGIAAVFALSLVDRDRSSEQQADFFGATQMRCDRAGIVGHVANLVSNGSKVGGPCFVSHLRMKGGPHKQLSQRGASRPLKSLAIGKASANAGECDREILCTRRGVHQYKTPKRLDFAVEREKFGVNKPRGTIE
jgi:hypothetical protein